MMRGLSIYRLGTRMRTPRGTNIGEQIRWNSSQPPQEIHKEVSPHIGFYKTFSRPIAKVLLMSMFTYQLAYWAWVKLEKDEIKSQKTVEIEELEKRLGDLTTGQTKTTST